ncbi:hypothetical protein IV99_03245 [Pectobacterium brasiliense]|nr:hypothetical protein IV99_03245 [Pectobacterium brasiliense]KHT25692.1 hypothetical protein RC95_00310 [Pectobacterium brasiliense]
MNSYLKIHIELSFSEMAKILSDIDEMYLYFSVGEAMHSESELIRYVFFPLFIFSAVLMAKK